MFIMINFYHESLNHNTRDALDAHDEDCLGAFLSSGAAAIANSMLRLDAKEKATCEAEYIIHAGRPIIFHLEGR